MRILSQPHVGRTERIFNLPTMRARAWWEVASAQFRKKKVIVVVIFSVIAFASVSTFTLLSQRHPRLTATTAALPIKHAASTFAPTLELHIANNGLVYIQGARVRSASRSLMVVAMEWKSAPLQWVIRTNEDTKFISANGEFGVFSDIAPGDFVNISGHLTGTSPEFSVQAEIVRETSERVPESTVVRLDELDNPD